MTFLPVPIMQPAVFTDDLEKKLIEIWAEYQRQKNYTQSLHLTWHYGELLRPEA